MWSATSSAVSLYPWLICALISMMRVVQSGIAIVFFTKKRLLGWSNEVWNAASKLSRIVLLKVASVITITTSAGTDSGFVGLSVGVGVGVGRNGPRQHPSVGHCSSLVSLAFNGHSWGGVTPGRQGMPPSATHWLTGSSVGAVVFEVVADVSFEPLRASNPGRRVNRVGLRRLFKERSLHTQTVGRGSSLHALRRDLDRR